jgi:hypothetical protein
MVKDDEEDEEDEEEEEEAEAVRSCPSLSSAKGNWSVPPAGLVAVTERCATVLSSWPNTLLGCGAVWAVVSATDG